MEEYLPWWLSAGALSAITVGFWLVLKRPLGVSGSWARVVMWKSDRAVREAEAPFRDNPALFKDALMEATIEEFGRERVMALLQKKHGIATDDQLEAAARARQGRFASRTPWTAHLTFLVMLAAGGLLSTAVRQDFQLHFDMGEVYTSLFGGGMGTFVTLFFGGILVGFGTQMGGGCTSGHALSGVSRLAPASIVATLTFFGTAILVSFAAHFLGGMQ